MNNKKKKKRILSEKPSRIILETYIVFEITTFHETDICDTVTLYVHIHALDVSFTN